MNEVKLKPCPFCGGKVKTFIAPIMSTVMFVCKKCGADVCFYGAEHEPKATRAWNRRTAATLSEIAANASKLSENNLGE